MTSSQSSSCVAKAQSERVVRSRNNRTFLVETHLLFLLPFLSNAQGSQDKSTLHELPSPHQKGSVIVRKDASYPTNGAAFLV